MAKPNVFLSYSTKDSLTDFLLAELEPALKAEFEGFMPPGRVRRKGHE